jgi:hypothetical protein
MLPEILIPRLYIVQELLVIQYSNRDLFCFHRLPMTLINRNYPSTRNFFSETLISTRQHICIKILFPNLFFIIKGSGASEPDFIFVTDIQ